MADQGAEEFLEDSNLQFRFDDLTANSTPTKGPIDYIPVLTADTIPSFARVSEGSSTYTLVIPIIHDTRAEDNELFRIYIDRPPTPDNTMPIQVDVIIEDGNDDFVYMGRHCRLGANSRRRHREVQGISNHAI